LDEEVYYKVVY